MAKQAQEKTKPEDESVAGAVWQTWCELPLRKRLSVAAMRRAATKESPPVLVSSPDDHSRQMISSPSQQSEQVPDDSQGSQKPL